MGAYKCCECGGIFCHHEVNYYACKEHKHEGFCENCADNMTDKELEEKEDR